MLILKLLLGGMPFFISYRIIFNRFDIPTQTLGNTRTIGYTFI
jgi:hypothetical protein